MFLQPEARRRSGRASNPRRVAMGSVSVGSPEAPDWAYESSMPEDASSRGYPRGGATPPFGKMGL